MKAADYKCGACDTITERWFEDTDHLPVAVNCSKCGYRATRVYSPTASIVHRGKAGNAKNGYTSSPVKIKKS